MDRINLRGINAYGRHGTEAAERVHVQPFTIDLWAELDLHAAQTTDDLSETLDYSGLHQRLVAIVAKTSYSLIERLAADLLAAIFEDRRVARAEVTVSKPAILNGATPSVTILRVNPNYENP